MKKIVLTGGGTAGHVTPHFALLDKFKDNNIEIYYIGSKNGIEKELVQDKNIPYYPISSGKLRRYMDLKNFTDPFRILAGFFQSIGHLRKIKPHCIFSKGGFVSVPVVIAGWLLRIPVIVHESDMTPGLANKLSQPFCKKILLTFEDTLKHVSPDKGIYTGSPVRESLADGHSQAGYDFTGFNREKPIIMMMGGSIGSVKINTVLRDALPQILQNFQVIHLCGKGNLDHSLDNVQAYRQYEYIKDELKDLFAISHMMISRAGSNSINEFIYLTLPSLLIPLSKAASRGDQILNAKAFEKQGFSLVLPEEDLRPQTLVEKLSELDRNYDQYKSNIEKNTAKNGSVNVFNAIQEFL